MAKPVRKNLMVDAEKLRELAKRRNKSESETVRSLVDFAHLAEEFEDIFQKLNDLGGIDDVFETLPDKVESR